MKAASVTYMEKMSPVINKLQYTIFFFEDAANIASNIQIGRNVTETVDKFKGPRNDKSRKLFVIKLAKAPKNNPRNTACSNNRKI